MISRTDIKAESWGAEPAAVGEKASKLSAARAAESSFEAFYIREFDRVYDCAYAFVGLRELALDATQEAFSRAFVRWSRLSKESWAVGWVITTAQNLVRRQLRLLSIARLVSRQESQNEGPSADRVDLVNAMAELPRRQRQALILHYLADLPIAIVAEQMGTSEGTVKAHLYRGRAKLGQLMRATD